MSRVDAGADDPELVRSRPFLAGWSGQASVVPPIDRSGSGMPDHRIRSERWIRQRRVKHRPSQAHRERKRHLRDALAPYLSCSNA